MQKICESRDNYNDGYNYNYNYNDGYNFDDVSKNGYLRSF